MDSKNRLNLKSISILVLVSLMLYFSYQFILLSDDSRVLEAIRSDPRVPYQYIMLFDVETMGGVRDTLSFDYGFEYTFFLRQFEAYRDSPDTTLASENRKIIGYVDMNLKVWYIAELRGDEILV